MIIQRVLKPTLELEIAGIDTESKHRSQSKLLSLRYRSRVAGGADAIT